MEIQNIPVTDSPNNDAIEAIVEVYFQAQGYITSAGKWFWVWEEGKKQRGYQDIDVLAVKGDETVIVSVTSNLDDKINTRGGAANAEMLEKLKGHLDRVHQYLNTVEQYQWMVHKPRKIRHMVAYNHAFERTLETISEALGKNGIEILSAKEILRSLSKHANQPNLKIQNQLLRTIQLLGKNVIQPAAPEECHAGRPAPRP